MRPEEVLILSGLPGCGKTTLATWLEERGWQRVNHDDLGASNLERAWTGLWQEMNVNGFLTECSQAGKPVVVEWSFPVELLFRARDFLGAGFNCWWVDGDRGAALECWRERLKPATPEAEGPFHVQLAKVEAAWPAIAAVYAGRIVRTLGPGPYYSPAEHTWRLMGLANASQADPAVWYAAYGSNLAYERFRCYIFGGKPPGGMKELPGCHQKVAPRRDERYVLHQRLFIAGSAESWGGHGVAFVGDAEDRVDTLARIFLVTKSQLEDIVAQENGYLPGRVALDLALLVSEGRVDLQLNGGKYHRVLFCGEEGGIPVVTCTTTNPGLIGEPTAPDVGYLRWIAKGLTERWELTPAKAAAYLFKSPGVALAYHSVEDLGRALRD